MIRAHKEKPYIALLGGSFNPPHAGHFRIALETHEALCPEKTLLIPAADPPHKAENNLLPFALRGAMLEAITASLPGLEVCRIEAERSGPSYTVDTLIALRERYPDHRLLFILGGDNFPLLPTWRRGLELPAWADLAVLPRGFANASGHPESPRICAPEDDFCRTALSLWPEAEAVAPPYPAVTKAFRLPLPATEDSQAYILYLPQPRLEVSSSLVRARRRQRRRLDFLVPSEVIRLLDAHADEVDSLWRSEHERSGEKKPLHPHFAASAPNASS